MRSVIATIATESYLDMAKQLFSSAYFDGAWDGDFLLLKFGKIKNEKLAWFRQRDIYVTPVEIIDQEAPVAKQILLSKISIFRNDLRQKWDKIILLDSDMIVRAPIRSLRSVQRIEAVQGVTKPRNKHKIYRPTRKDPISLRRKYEKLKQMVDLNAPSVNGGLYVLDTAWIAPHTYDSIKAYYLEFSELLLSDERIIGTYFGRNIELLPLHYNTYVRVYFLRSPANELGTILHFLDQKKRPWERSHPFYGVWKKNFDRAEFLRPGSQAGPFTDDEEIKEKWEKSLRRRFQFFQLIRPIVRLWIIQSPTIRKSRIVKRCVSFIRKIKPRHG